MVPDAGGDGEDPGWGYALRAIGWGLIPGLGPIQMRRSRAEGVHGLATLRSMFVTFVVALLLIGGAIAVIVNLSSLKGGTLSPTPIALGVAGFGIAILLVTPRLERPLDCADAPSLAASYRTRFFLRLAFSETSALLGFVGFILTGRWWIYPVGAVFTAVGYARLAPTASNLSRDQDRLIVRGCTRSLVAALAFRPARMPPRSS